MTEKRSENMTIGVFADHFQGAFTGEIANQIRQYCLIRGFKFVGFSTGGLGDYNCQLSIAQLDVAIIIRNGISNTLAQELLKCGIATVSIAYDYFPLEIPLVSSDNVKGAEMVFRYLYARGHKMMAFVGDLSQLDIRKRYERFVELMDEYQLDFNEDLLINAKNMNMSGGIQVGDTFISRACNATAVFCASGLTAIGFVKRLEENKIELSDNLEVVGYDAMPLISALCPNITAVDQNVHLIAYRAVSTACMIREGKIFDRKTLAIEPKLIKSEDVAKASESPYLATSVDLPEIHHPSYMSSLINHSFSWSDEIFESKFDGLMSIAPVFEKFMRLASFTRLSLRKDGQEVAQLQKIYTLSGVEKFDNNADCFCDAEDFPPSKLASLDLSKYDNCTHFFIRIRGRSRGVISVFGDSLSTKNLSSYLYFAGQMETVMKFMSLHMENKIVNKLEDGSALSKIQHRADAVQVKHIIEWNIVDQITDWSEGALAILGLNSPIDINIYQHMDIIDRVHEEDIENLRQHIATCATSSEDFTTTSRFKTKKMHYVPMTVEAKSIEDSEGNINKVKFLVSQVDMD